MLPVKNLIPESVSRIFPPSFSISRRVDTRTNVSSRRALLKTIFSEKAPGGRHLFVFPF
jgi:hypothetical protein